MFAERISIQFSDKRSPIHSIHPIAKLFWMILIAGILMVNRNYVFSIILLILIIALFILSGFNIFNIKGTKIIFITSLFIALLQLVFNSGGNQLISLFGISVTDVGIEKAIYFGTRFPTIIFIGFLFILTTNPNYLVCSLMQAGISYRLGFSIISALRLMSIFSAESEKIYYSSVIKGSNYAFFPISSFFNTITNYFRLLFVSIFEKVDALVISLEGRGFGNRNKRTFLESQPFKRSDKALLILGLVIMILLITTSCVPIWSMALQTENVKCF